MRRKIPGNVLCLSFALTMVMTMAFAGTGGAAWAEPQPLNTSIVKIGISLPTQREERWVLDKESFEKIAASMGIEVAIQIADYDAGRQQTQCENLIIQGATALIVAPHDGEAAKNIVEIAHNAGVPVISYDRLIMGADVDLHVTFDQFKIGYLMGDYIAKNLDSGNIVILKGDPRDNTTIPFREGAIAAIQSKLDSGAFKIVAEQNCIDWQPSAALRHMEQALTANNNEIQGVIAQNDGIAGAVIQALAAVGLAGKVPVTGQDCETDAISRIREGTQGMTVFSDVRDMAEAAFQAAVKMSNGQDPGAGSTENNGKIDVPVLEVSSTAVTKDNWRLPIDKGYINEPSVSVSIDGRHVQFTESSGQPFIDENSRTQVPFRIVLEAFGADVDWDSANKTAIAVKGGITVKVPIGTNYIYKNGAKVMNDTNSLIKDSRTYLPIRIVLEAFGADVDWDSGTKTVVVKSKEASEQAKLAAEVAANMRNLKSCDIDEVHVYDYQISDEKTSFTISKKGNLFFDPPNAKVVRTMSVKGDNTITETYWIAEGDEYMRYTLSEDGWSKEYDDADWDIITMGHLGELLAKLEAVGTDKVNGASVTKFEGKITYGEYLETFLLETEDDDVDFLSIDVPFTLWVDTESKLLVKYSCDFKNYLLAYLGAEYYGEPVKTNKCYLESVFTNFNNATDFKLPKGIPYQR